MKRTYAEVVGEVAPAAAAPGKSGSPNPVARQLATVAATLAAAAPPAVAASPSVPERAPPQVAAAPEAPPAGEPTPAPPSATRSSLLSDIKQMEAVVATMSSPVMATAKAELETRLAEKRSELQALRPIGQRLDSTRAALERSKKRREQAEQAMALAQSTLAAAVEEEKNLTTSLMELEATVGSETPSPEHSLASLGEQLAAAVEQVRSFSGVDPGVGEAAQRESEALLARFQVTIQAAENAVQAAKQAVPRRLTHKQPTPQPAELAVPDHRLTKKQKVQSHLEAFFGPAKPRGSLVMAVAGPAATKPSPTGRYEPYGK